MKFELNVGNSLFSGLNDRRGIAICGYEWGFSKKDQEQFSNGAEPEFDPHAITTFPNKVPAHGERALDWIYERKIIKWFGLWGHPLSRQGVDGVFERCLVQTNWCNTEGHHIEENYFQKLSANDQIENFLFHVRTLDPALLLFMGSAMIDVLQVDSVMNPLSLS